MKYFIFLNVSLNKEFRLLLSLFINILHNVSTYLERKWNKIYLVKYVYVLFF